MPDEHHPAGEMDPSVYSKENRETLVFDVVLQRTSTIVFKYSFRYACEFLQEIVIAHLHRVKTQKQKRLFRYSNFINIQSLSQYFVNNTFNHSIFRARQHVLSQYKETIDKYYAQTHTSISNKQVLTLLWIDKKKGEQKNSGCRYDNFKSSGTRSDAPIFISPC